MNMSDNPAGLVSTEQLEIAPYKWVHPDECGEILGGIAAELRGNRERPSKKPGICWVFSDRRILPINQYFAITGCAQLKR